MFNIFSFVFLWSLKSNYFENRLEKFDLVESLLFIAELVDVQIFILSK